MEPLFTLQHHRNMFWLSVCPRDRVFTKKNIDTDMHRTM